MPYAVLITAPIQSVLHNSPSSPPDELLCICAELMYTKKNLVALFLARASVLVSQPQSGGYLSLSGFCHFFYPYAITLSCVVGRSSGTVSAHAQSWLLRILVHNTFESAYTLNIHVVFSALLQA
jgi:hypothetical protein